MGGHDAERHQLPCLGRRHRGLHRRLKRRRVGKHMVGRQHQQQRVVTRLPGLQRGQRNGWRRVASRRLQQNAGQGYARLTSLLSNQEAVLVVAHHQRGV